MSNDFLQIPITEYDEPSRTVYIFGSRSGATVNLITVLHQVTGSAVRYEGCWSFRHRLFNKDCVAHFPDDTISYFSVLESDPDKEMQYDK